MIKLSLALIISLFTFISSFANNFSRIDEIISQGISNHYFPGAQVLIGNDREILYSGSYGNFTYDEFSPPVTEQSMFDLASVTKVVATTSAIIQLYQEGKIGLNDKISLYIPEFANNGKEDIKILNLLIHNSGLKAFIPFYKYYNTREDVLNAIYNINLDYQTNSKFVYSDINAILLGIIVERLTWMSLDEYCRKNIFIPLDMYTTGFVPDDNLKERILPTEYDNYWRNRLLQGEVHDEAASLLGGVAGNAGLFSNAKDLYKFMRSILSSSKHYDIAAKNSNEKSLFHTEVINLFTERYTDVQYSNSRALGWDTKPDPNSSRFRIPCGELISENCFGHTGYTGTSIWCDKDRNLIIIFLTNRVYPSRENEGIRELRPEIHNAAIEIAADQIIK